MISIQEQDFLLAVETTGEQREIWNSCQFDESSSLCFNESITIEFDGNLIVEALKKSLNELLTRHASLRSCFSTDGRHMMVYHDQEASLETIYYQSKEEVFQKEKEQCLTLFDLTNGPLIRFVLMEPRNKDESSYLILTAHHIICDGWSWAIITNEIGHFYNCFVDHIFRPLPKATQYWNYSKYKRLLDKRDDQDFWKEVFKKPQQKVEYARVLSRPAFRTFHSQRIDTPISSQTIVRIRELARKNKLTVYQYLLSAFFMTLSRKAKVSDITVGISQAGQTNGEFSSLVGHCVELLPIRIQNFNQDNLLENFSIVKNAMLDAQKHSNLSFGEICNLTTVERDPSKVPLVPVTFNLDVQPEGQGLNFNGLKCKFKTNPRYFENFEMFINLTLIGNDAVIENQYNTDLYSSDEIHSFQEVYSSFLDHLASGRPAEDFSFKFQEGGDYVAQTSLPEKALNIIQEKEDELLIPIELEEELKKIWMDILIVDDVKPSDGFFALGGHSLLVTEVVLAVRERLGITLTMKDLFLNQNFEKFSQLVFEKQNITEELGARDLSPTKIEMKNGDMDKFPLSWQQQRSWLFQKLNPESTLFNLPSLFQFKGSLNLSAFKQALEHFQDSHPLINSVLQQVDGIPYWKLKQNNKCKVEVIDLEKLYPTEKIENIIENLVELNISNASKAFDMEGRLYQAKIYYYKDEYIFLAQKVHHIIWDGWCYDIFLTELENNYKVIVRNETLKAPVKLTYFDYAQWQSELPPKKFYKEKLNFWVEKFSDVPDPLDLPIKPGFKRTEKKFKGKSIFLKWGEEEVVSLERIARKHGTTLFNVLITTFKLFLGRYTGQSDIVVGTPVRGRDAEDLDKIIGFFVNNIAIRTTIDSNLTFSENLSRVIESSTLAFENSLIPFDVIVRETVKIRDGSRTPIYQAFFMYQDATNRNTDFCGSERSSYRLPRGACHTDIDFWARRDRQGMIGGFDFDEEIFNDDQMSQMADDFEYFLSEIASIEYKKSAVKEARLINPKHFDYVIEGINNTTESFSNNSTVSDLVDEIAKKYGERVATSSSKGQLTYREVSDLSDSLAFYLIEKGVQPGELIGMALQRSHYLPVCLLGIIKAGAGYVPLDPSYPEERLSYMIENSKLEYVICDPEDVNLKIFSMTKTIGLGDPTIQNQAPWTMEPSLKISERKESIKTTDTCYVIYTSGSTGLPKGVDISHRAMINFLESMVHTPGLQKDDTLIAVTTMSFDIAVLEVYAPLLVGARVHICTREESMFGDSLIDVIRKEEGTFLQATPATWRQLVVSGLADYTKSLASSNRKFKSLCGGEPLPSDLKDQILESVHELWNMYGPTETTVWSTCHKVNKGDSWVSVGRPINNTQIFILSENLEIVPYGAIGEICIGGDGLARGYLNREDLTTERFVKCRALGEKIVYRTGDLGRYRENGLLECLGRNDGQVKVRGFRIELGEIESIISQVNGIQSQVVVVREDRPGDTRLVAYFIRNKVETRTESQVVKDIQENIKENLPFYMMPSYFVELLEFPLTLNGKIDRKKLPSPTGMVEETSIKPVATSKHVDETVRAKFENIWKECLGIDSVNYTDDFFQVGGHSLLSVTLFSRIETEFGIVLPLSTLFQNTKFGELLEILEGQKEVTKKHTIDQIDSDFLVTLRKTRGSDKALFLFHGVGGNILNYKKLIQFIPDSFDVYGVQSPGVLGEAELASSVSEMAILYANDITKIKGYKHVIFGGGSMGGLLAFETAREVYDLHGTVDDIIMFDTFGPFEAFSHIIEQKNPGIISRFKTFSYYKLREINAKFHYWLAGLKKKPVPHRYRHFLVELNNYGLMNRHRILPLNAHVHLLRGPITQSGNYSVGDLGWELVAKKGCTAHIVNGAKHENFVESPLAGKSFRKILEGF